MHLSSRYLVLPFLVSAAFFCPCNPTAALADFDAGLEAYDGGDIAAARDAWQAAAQAGDLDAQVALADLYAQGLGLPRDQAAASDLYRRAALKGHPVAQLNLGERYALGLGLPQRPIEAYLWFSLATENGSRWAAEQRVALEKSMTEAALAEAEARLASWPRAQ